MRPLEQKLKDMHSLYVENFGEHIYHLPTVDKWPVDNSKLLEASSFTHHEARFIRLVHAILDRASPGELITSPYEYVRVFAKIKYSSNN